MPSDLAVTYMFDTVQVRFGVFLLLMCNRHSLYSSAFGLSFVIYAQDLYAVYIFMATELIFYANILHVYSSPRMCERFL